MTKCENIRENSNVLHNDRATTQTGPQTRHLDTRTQKSGATAPFLQERMRKSCIKATYSKRTSLFYQGNDQGADADVFTEISSS